MLMQNSRDVIMRLNGQIRLTYVSPASLQVFGVPPEQMLGNALRDYAIAEDAPGLIRNGDRLFSGETDTDTHTFRIQHADGGVRWLQVNTRRERDLYGEPTGDYVIVARDVTLQQELQVKFENLAISDGVTGLAGRRAFDEALERAWRAALAEPRPLSMILVEVDHFQTMNGAYGPRMGDQCLGAVARAVCGATSRSCAFVARYGGEEIAVILEETDAPGAVEAASRVIEAVQAMRISHVKNPAGGGFVSVSVGVATAATGSAVGSHTDLIEAAGRALHAAKHAGGNRFACGPVMAMPDK